MNSIGRTAMGWLTTCVLLVAPCSIATAQTDWESTIRQNTPADIELTSIQEGETEIVIRGTANSNPDLAKYMRALSENVGDPELAQVTREDDKSVFVLMVKKSRH